MRWVNFRVIWAWKPPFFRFFKYLTTRPNNPTNYNNRPDILKLLTEPNRTRLLGNRPEPYPTNLVPVPSLLLTSKTRYFQRKFLKWLCSNHIFFVKLLRLLKNLRKVKIRFDEFSFKNTSPLVKSCNSIPIFKQKSNPFDCWENLDMIRHDKKRKFLSETHPKL